MMTPSPNCEPLRDTPASAAPPGKTPSPAPVTSVSPDAARIVPDPDGAVMTIATATAISNLFIDPAPFAVLLRRMYLDVAADEAVIRDTVHRRHRWSRVRDPESIRIAHVLTATRLAIVEDRDREAAA